MGFKFSKCPHSLNFTLLLFKFACFGGCYINALYSAPKIPPQKCQRCSRHNHCTHADHACGTFCFFVKAMIVWTEKHMICHFMISSQVAQSSQAIISTTLIGQALASPTQAGSHHVLSECHVPEIYVANTESPTLGGCCICCTSITCPKFYNANTESPTCEETRGQYGIQCGEKQLKRGREPGLSTRTNG